MNAAQLLSDLGSQMGINGLQFDDQGCAQLVFDSNIVINFEHDAVESRLQVYSVVGKIPAEGKERVFQVLLEANLFGMETAGAVLALDSLENEIVLFRTLEGGDISGVQFGDLVGTFVDAVETWTAKLASADTFADSESGAGDLAPSFIRA